MYIKETKRENNKIKFQVYPVFSTIELVKRCRSIVDAFYHYRNYETFTEKYNFRKCCLEAELLDYKVRSIRITELKHKDKDFAIDVYRSGMILLTYGDDFTEDESDSLFDRFERLINYAL